MENDGSFDWSTHTGESLSFYDIAGHSSLSEEYKHDAGNEKNGHPDQRDHSVSLTYLSPVLAGFNRNMNGIQAVFQSTFINILKRAAALISTSNCESLMLNVWVYDAKVQLLSKH